MAEHLAILFADISGSTSLYEALGDTVARTITSSCVAALSAITTRHQGRVIKTIGDEVMCTFPDADLAAQAALSMQEGVKVQSPSWGRPLQIRVGFHFGEVIEERGDVFGDAVNVAARIAGQAKADQILTTSATRDYLDHALRAKMRLVESTRVKGRIQQLEIHELTWGEPEEVTTFARAFNFDDLDEPGVSAELTVGGRAIHVDDHSQVITLGRGKMADVFVDAVTASRLHARIELRRGRIFVVDQSTNGTFVVLGNGDHYLHRDELELEGEGRIGLGAKPSSVDRTSIHFVIQSA